MSTNARLLSRLRSLYGPIACLTVLSGCDQILDLGGLHDRSQDAGGTVAAGHDGSTRDTGAPIDATTEASADSAGSAGRDDSGSDATAGGDSSDDATLDATGNDTGAGSDAGADATGNDTGAGNDAALDATGADGGASGLGALDASCSPPGALACAGHAQQVTLLCAGGGAWQFSSTCPSEQNCDTRPGPKQGRCAAIDPVCVSASPDTNVCSTSSTAVHCGPDLVSESPAATCSGATPFCSNGACSATPQTPPSCATIGAGLTNCGSSSESCCTTLEVPGGTFYRTYKNSGSGPTGEADPATVSGFRLDKYQVTVGRFRQFVSAWTAGYTPPAGSGKHTHLNSENGLNVAGGGYEPGWVTSDNANVAPTTANLTCTSVSSTWPGYSTWTSTPGSQENLPINCTTWLEAYAFCIWDGGFLPSDAEREYTGAGGSQQREYTWGTAAPGTGNQYAIYNCYFPGPGNSGGCTSVANIAAVGTATLGVGLWGQLDLSSDLSEWTRDYSDTVSFPNPCVDCLNLTIQDAYYDGMQARGDDFHYGVANLSPSTSGFEGRGDRAPFVGFRCARTP